MSGNLRLNEAALHPGVMETCVMIASFHAHALGLQDGGLPRTFKNFLLLVYPTEIEI